MKKIIISLLLSVFIFSQSSAYSPTSKDELILKSIYSKIDAILTKSPERIENLYEQIWLIKDKVKSERLGYILDALESYSYRTLTSRNNIDYKVLEVIDGDTVALDYLWTKIKVRMIWIDAPENSKTRFWYIEPYGYDAKEYLKDLVEWKSIKLELDSSQWLKDKYDRTLWYIFLDWENINNTMILEGYSKEYTYDKDYKYMELFLSSEKEAKLKEKLIWSDAGVQEVEEGSLDSGCVIKWNISWTSKEKIYHTPDCPDYNKTVISTSKWEQFFCTEEDAINAGWRKSLNCK